jgi:hypothetical protein
MYKPIKNILGLTRDKAPRHKTDKEIKDEEEVKDQEEKVIKVKVKHVYQSNPIP